MISLNLTIVVELALFALFYGVSRRYIFSPLHRLMISRQDRIGRDEDRAAHDEREAARVRDEQAARFAGAQRAAAQRLREARFAAYRRNRIEADERRRRAESEVSAFRARVRGDVKSERERYGAQLPELVAAIDRQINIEGSLL